MTTFHVATADQFNQALAGAQGGDTIGLAAGAYNGVAISNLNFAASLNITSDDAAAPATITGLTVFGSSGLHFSNLTISGATGAGCSPVLIMCSSQIDLENIGFQNQTASDESSVGVFNSMGITAHNAGGSQVFASTDVLTAERFSLITNSQTPFPGSSGWVTADPGSQVALTDDGSGGMSVQVHTAPAAQTAAAPAADPAPAADAGAVDTPIQFTGVDLFDFSQMMA